MRKDKYVHGFGERLSKSISKLGISDHEFSRRLGLVDSTVCGYVNYNHMPSCYTLAKMAVMLDVSTDYLLGLEKGVSK